MKALMPTCWTITPFNKPNSIAAPRASAAVGQKPSAAALATRTTAENAATDATERSKLPLIRTTVIATATRAHWLSIEWLPKYAPELNDIETVWRDLKAHYLAHQTFTDADVLDQSIHHAVEALNRERKPNLLANQRIPA